MHSLVVYDTTFGITRSIAEVIERELEHRGSVRLLDAEEALAREARPTGLLVVGGPTQGHRMTPALQAYVSWLASTRATGPFAAFDTRLRMARLLSGSAARQAARTLRHAGMLLVVAPESFFVTRHGPTLEPGELERASSWAAGMGALAAVGDYPVVGT